MYNDSIRGVRQMDKKYLGERIKEMRLRMGLNQEDFGLIIGDATKSMVSKWERGESSPSSQRQKILIEIGDKLGVSLFNNDIPINDFRMYVEREFYNIYDEYIERQLREYRVLFERLLDGIEKESLKEEAVSYILSQNLDRTTLHKDIERKLYDFLHTKFNRLLREYPKNDNEVVEIILNKIQHIEKSLKSYYYNQDGNLYSIEGLNRDNYQRLKSILEFSKFQINNLGNN